MSTDTMTLKERFDWNTLGAVKLENLAGTYQLEGNLKQAAICAQRALVHATLAQAIATRMVAIETADLVRVTVCKG